MREEVNVPNVTVAAVVVIATVFIIVAFLLFVLCGGTVLEVSRSFPGRSYDQNHSDMSLFNVFTIWNEMENLVWDFRKLRSTRLDLQGGLTPASRKSLSREKHVCTLFPSTGSSLLSRQDSRSFSRRYKRR